MESTKLFISTNNNLKNKIYEKYKIKFSDIRKNLEIALIAIYGKKHSKIINQKLDKIYFINFFSKKDLQEHFEYSYYSFNPIVLGPNDVLPEKEKSNIQEDLEEQFTKLFGTDILTKPEKKYDKDIYNYLDECSIYYSNLYNEFSSTYPISPIIKKIKHKMNLEYFTNSSMYSCTKNELLKLNLLLDSDIVLPKIEQYLFYKNSFLVNNINNNFEKTDIIFINPIEFNKDDIFELVRNIVISINTDFKIIDNTTFSFDMGFNTCFIKHIGNIDLKNDNKNVYDFFVDSINNFLTYEIIDYMQNNNLNILCLDELSLDHSINKHKFTNFYKLYKNDIIDSIICKDSSILFNKIGKENFDNLIETVENNINEILNLPLENFAKNKEFLVQEFLKNEKIILDNMKKYNEPKS